MIAFEKEPLTSNMQTVEKKWYFPSFPFNAGNERQRRPDESVRTFGAAYKHYASECVHVFDCRNKDIVKDSYGHSYEHVNII